MEHAIKSVTDVINIVPESEKLLLFPVLWMLAFGYMLKHINKTLEIAIKAAPLAKSSASWIKTLLINRSLLVALAMFLLSALLLLAECSSGAPVTRISCVIIAIYCGSCFVFGIFLMLQIAWTCIVKKFTSPPLR